MCEKLSHRTVEIGLVPLGAIGVTACGSWQVLAALTGIGIFGGFYLVPLFALVQSRTPKPEISRVIAGNNILNAFFIVSAAVFGIVAQKVLHWSIPQFYLAVAIMNGVVAIYIFTLVPEFLMRFVAWMLTHLLYHAHVV